MEAIAFESIAKGFGVPAAVAFFLWWNTRTKPAPNDIGREIVAELSEIRERLTKLEVIVEERTR